MKDDPEALKELMCDVGRRIWQRGYCAGNEGNHSVRVADDRILCTPTGVSKGFLRPEMICTVDLRGRVVEAAGEYRPSSEVKIHLQIYKSLPDVRAVVHSHPPHATAFAVAGVNLPEGIYPEAEFFLGRVPIAQYATPSTQALADALVPHLQPHVHAVLLANHGAVTFDTDLIGAYYRLEVLDAYAQILLLAGRLGRVNVLGARQMRELMQVKRRFGLDDPRDGIDHAVNEPFLASLERPADRRRTGEPGGTEGGPEDLP